MLKTQDTKRLFDKVLGFYFPAFLFMQINTDEELSDLYKLSKENRPTFYHEYVHFLQDITTTYGLWNIYRIVDLQKAINKKIFENNSNTFKLPVIKLDKITETNIDLSGIYYGDSPTVDEGFDIIITKIDSVEDGTIPGFEYVPNIVVTANNGFNKDCNFNFGAYCLQESMAYLIEDQLFDKNITPQSPYKTVELVVDFIYPEIAKNKRNLIYMCDAALNVDHPGKFFYDVICKMKEKSFVPNNPKEIYAFFQDNAPKNFDIYSFFENISQQAEKQILDYFTIPIFDAVKIWLKDIISSARKLRLNNFLFWSNYNGPSKLDN
jgi:hypothetical protein